MILPFREHEPMSSHYSAYPLARKPYADRIASSGSMPEQQEEREYQPRRERARITLPPLHAITSAANLDEQYEPTRSFPTLPQHATSNDLMPEATRSNSRAWPVNSSNSRLTINRYGSGSTSPPAAERPQGSVSRTDLLVAPLPLTRPRSLSSPHRTPLDLAAQRAQQSFAAEVDRLLENFIYVQDINKRLGLPAGPSASPRTIQSPDAINLLLEQMFEELDTLAQFSQSRADVVARDLGLAYTPKPPVLHARSPTGSTYSISGQPAYRRDADERAPLLPPLEGASSRTAYNAYPTAPRLPRAASDEYLRGTQGSHYTHHPSQELGGASRYDTGVDYEHNSHRRNDLLDRRHLTGKGMKRVRKRKNEHHQECLGCQAKETPEWRKGPMGPRTLCNACGLLYAKLSKRRQQDTEASAKASGFHDGGTRRSRDDSPGARQASFDALRAELETVNGLRNRPPTTSMTSNNRVGEASGSTSEPGSAPLDPTDPYSRSDRSALPSYRSRYGGREHVTLPSLHHPGSGRSAAYPTATDAAYRESDGGYAYHVHGPSRARAHTLGHEAFLDSQRFNQQAVGGGYVEPPYASRYTARPDNEADNEQRVEYPAAPRASGEPSYRCSSQPSSPVRARYPPSDRLL